MFFYVRNSPIITHWPQYEEETKRNPYRIVEPIVICHKSNLSLAGPEPNVAGLSQHTWCCIASTTVSRSDAELPARKSETASQGHGMRGTTGRFAADDQAQSKC